jgi:sulfur carrier protein ThiS
VRARWRTLKAGSVLDDPMHITAEILPGRREESIELRPPATGLDLLRALRLAPDAHILMRGEGPIPADAPLVDGERIRVVGVVSGGSLR